MVSDGAVLNERFGQTAGLADTILNIQIPLENAQADVTRKTDSADGGWDKSLFDPYPLPILGLAVLTLQGLDLRIR